MIRDLEDETAAAASECKRLRAAETAARDAFKRNMREIEDLMEAANVKASKEVWERSQRGFQGY